MFTEIDTNILVVDDTDVVREALVKGLSDYGFQNVVSVKSGEEAIEWVTNRPEWTDVAVIDHDLVGALDGIQTTRRIFGAALNELYVIVFTNIPTSYEKVSNYEAAALAAGAYRYLYRAGSVDAKAVTDFVEEIRQLRQIRQKAQALYESQQNFPSLLPFLDIVVSLFDKKFKVWYTNPSAAKYQKSGCLPCHECPASPGTCGVSSPCRGCSIVDTFSSGRRQEKIVARPFAHGAGLKYFHVITTPVFDEKHRDRVLAVMQFIEDLTDSERIRTFAVNDRLRILAQSLHDIPRGFDRVRIYEKVEGSEALKLVSALGYYENFEGTIVEIAHFFTFREAITHLQEHGVGKFWNIQGYTDHLVPKESKEKFIQWPLMKGERLLGLISVNGVPRGRPCNEDKVAVLADYAQEAIRIIESRDTPSDSEFENLQAEINQLLAQVDNNLLLQREPSELVKTLIERAYTLTDSDFAHLRYRSPDGRHAILFPAGQGDYFKIAPKVLSLLDHNNPSVRVMKSGVPDSSGHAKADVTFRESLATLSDDVQEAFVNVESYFILPLKYDGHTIGSIALYKCQRDHYNIKRREVFKGLARRLAPALNDFLLYAARTEKRDLETREDLLRRVVHNLRQPTNEAQLFISTLKRDYKLEPRAQELLDDAESSIIRIASLIKTFLAFTKDIAYRAKKADLVDLLNEGITRFQKTHRGTAVSIEIEGIPSPIVIDVKGIEWVIEEMLENAATMRATEIKIKATFTDKSTTLSLEDNGDPIPTDLGDAIYDRFRTTHPLGTGLGLFYVRRIVEEHHGTIMHDSSLTTGAKFVIRLPKNFLELEKASLSE